MLSRHVCLLATAVAGALLVGCGPIGPQAPIAPALTPSVAADPTSTSSLRSAKAPPVTASARVTATVNAQGAFDVAFLPNGTALLTQTGSREIWRLSPEGADPVVAGRLDDVVLAPEGAGIRGIVLSPTFRQDHCAYVFLATATDHRVVQLDWQAGQLSLGRVVLAGIPAGAHHAGGALAFGPDGLLYVATGDLGDPAAAADPGSLAGKILRIAPDGSVPPDNPRPGSPVLSSGHHDVVDLTWDAAGGLVPIEAAAVGTAVPVGIDPTELGTLRRVRTDAAGQRWVLSDQATGGRVVVLPV